MGNVNGTFDVVRYWNGVATEDETVVIAAKANGKIEECIWTKKGNLLRGIDNCSGAAQSAVQGH